MAKYYETEALPLADEQIAAAKMAYKLGSIDYVQFIQNMEAGINTKQEYLEQKSKLFELEVEINYLSGN